MTVHVYSFWARKWPHFVNVLIKMCRSFGKTGILVYLPLKQLVGPVPVRSRTI